MSTETHDAIMTAIQTYSEENGKFVDKGVKASATRARKALAELSKLIKAMGKRRANTARSICMLMNHCITYAYNWNRN